MANKIQTVDFGDIKVGAIMGEMRESIPETSEATRKIEAKLTEIFERDEITPSDFEVVRQYGEALKFEYRTKRFALIRRLHRIIERAIDQIEMQLEQGMIDVSANQLRLLIQLFLEQTRDEFGDKTPDTLIDQRKQTVNITTIEVDTSKRDNGKVIEPS